MKTRIVIILALLLLPACVTPEPPPEIRKPDYSRPLQPGERALVKLSPSEYPDFESSYLDRDALLEAVEQSIDYMGKPSSKTHFPVEGITHDRVKRSLTQFRDDLRQSFSARLFAEKVKSHFDVYMSTGCDSRGTVLFTGYCEPIVRASLKRTPQFNVPLYRLPDDLVKDAKGNILGRKTATDVLLPYYTRQEIDEDGKLEGRGLELAWVEHPLDAFIIHVQGSATLKLTDGRLLKIGYAGKNGRTYRSLGKALIKSGKMHPDEVSLDRIRKYFEDHPKDLLPYLYRNESYVFFTENEGGPYGSIGASVTPYHTIATDKSIFPRAAITFLDTSLPMRDDRGAIAYETYRGYALDQDTGGAIRSPGRVDVFMGTGREAEHLAGRVRHEGRLYYLFVR
jgi:membrane-bound lytic murein transglycosylase A